MLCAETSLHAEDYGSLLRVHLHSDSLSDRLRVLPISRESRLNRRLDPVLLANFRSQLVTFKKLETVKLSSLWLIKHHTMKMYGEVAM
jgi:hypothetical protein